MRPCLPSLTARAVCGLFAFPVGLCEAASQIGQLLVHQQKSILGATLELTDALHLGSEIIC